MEGIKGERIPEKNYYDLGLSSLMASPNLRVR